MVYFNTDEALLDDKDRPRDQYWFKILPWRQMDKWRLRNTNKSLVDYFSICWWKEVTGIAAADMNFYTSVKIPLYTNNKWKYKLTWTYPSPFTEDYLESISITEKIWDSNWKNDNWRVYIPNTWVYMIQYQMEFIWQSWTSTPTATSAPKLHSQLEWYWTNWELLWALENADWWWIVNPDNVRSINLNYLEKWQSIWLAAIHSRDWIKCFCRWCIKIQKLS